MNCKRFTARNSREALTLVRQAFGEDAVVLSTKPCAEGVEVLAMAPEGMAHIEQISASAPKVSAPAVKQTPQARKGKGLAERIEPEIAAPVEDDVRKLSMSTLSFQDFVRERMLKRAAPRLRVLGHSEIPETHSIRIGSVIGAAP